MVTESQFWWLCQRAECCVSAESPLQVYLNLEEWMVH